jgi:methyl-accepting chemotaxis protein
MKSNIFRLELLLAAMLPVTAIFIVGVVGLEQRENTGVSLFLGVLFACAIAVFFAEIALVRFMQRVTKNQYAQLVEVCQAYMAGQRERRAPLLRENALSPLAQTLNALLDNVNVSIQQAQHTGKATNDVQQLELQIRQLVTDIKPIMDGNLRVRASVPAGRLGMVADICNALIEELANLAKWTRYSSTQVMSKTQTLLSSSIELAQTSEIQTTRFSDTTETVEKLVAFIQRLSSTLQLNVELIHEIRAMLLKRPELQKGSGESTLIVNTTQSLEDAQQQTRLLTRINTDTQRLEALLNELLVSAQANATLAESMISDLYAIAQRIHQSSASILQTAEHIHSLAKLAQQWNASIENFQLPEETLDYAVVGENNTAMRAPVPTDTLGRQADM